MIFIADTCQSNDTTSIVSTDLYNQNDCPEINGTNFSLFIFTFYAIFMNVLLVTILISIFK
jgi:hypothetical protein